MNRYRLTINAEMEHQPETHPQTVITPGAKTTNATEAPGAETTTPYVDNHRSAAELIGFVVDGLRRLVSLDGEEDINFHNPVTLDEFIQNLIVARSYMARADEAAHHNHQESSA